MRIKKPFKCEMNGYSCSQKANLNRQVQAVHENIKQNKALNV